MNFCHKSHKNVVMFAQKGSWLRLPRERSYAKTISLLLFKMTGDYPIDFRAVNKTSL